MDIYLIRHTRTAAPTGLCYGQTDVALADDFADDLLKLRGKLPDSFTKATLISSPLSRCRLLAERLGNEVVIDERLGELNFGDWEGRPFDNIDPDVLRHWTDHFVEVAPPNGESFSDLHRRIGGFWHELLQQPHEQVGIITHAGVIRALLAEVLKLPLANAFQLRVDPGSVHKLRQQNDYTYVDFLNL